MIALHAAVVYQMLRDGWTDERICNELGMESEELIRLKYVTGYAKLYENVKYNNSWTPAFVKKGEKYNG